MSKRKAFVLVLTATCFSLFSVNIAAQQGDEALFGIWDARGKEGYIDARGNTIIEPAFDAVTAFSEGLAAVRVGEKWGYIDRTGKIVIAPVNFDSILKFWYPDFTYPGKGGYMDKTGAWAIKPQSRAHGLSPKDSRWCACGSIKPSVTRNCGWAISLS